MEIAQIRKNDRYQRRRIYLQNGDKYTKKPLQYCKYLILLGRMHIQVFNVANFTTSIVQNNGEDYAEKFGQKMK